MVTLNKAVLVQFTAQNEAEILRLDKPIRFVFSFLVAVLVACKQI